MKGLKNIRLDDAQAVEAFQLLRIQRIEAVAEALSENLNACTGDHRIIRLSVKIVDRIQKLDA